MKLKDFTKTGFARYLNLRLSSSNSTMLHLGCEFSETVIVVENGISDWTSNPRRRWIYSFYIQLSMNNTEVWVLKLWLTNQCKKRKTKLKPALLRLKLTVSYILAMMDWLDKYIFYLKGGAWRNSYHLTKWTRQGEFKFWMKSFMFSFCANPIERSINPFLLSSYMSKQLGRLESLAQIG